MERTSIDLDITQDSKVKRFSPSASYHPRTRHKFKPSLDVAIQIEDDNVDNTPRIVRRKRQAVESTTTTTTTTPASTTVCICPSTSTTSTTESGGSTSSTPFSEGTTTPDGECICPGNTDTTIEVETSTALPINSISGRRLRRELLDMELNQFQSKFETKLFKNIPFLKMYL
jgi:hypothetical protein